MSASGASADEPADEHPFDDDALEEVVLECLETADPDAALVARLAEQPAALARGRRLLAQMARLERLDAQALLDQPTPRADDRSTWPQVPGVELSALVGRGGQGFVFRGRQSYLDREVAVKVLAPELQSPEFVARFRREARLLAALQHPHVVACYDAGVDESGRCRLVMEWVDGPNLRQYLDRHGKLPWPQAVRLADELAQALGAAHAGGLIHRDVKPENVLLQPHGTGEFAYRAKLADLGLARPQRRRDDASLLTPAGAVLGTPVTMAPEQFDDPEQAGPRADLYGLGCILHHALTGKPAFVGPGISELILAKAAVRGATSREPLPEVPRVLSDLVWQLLAFDAAARPADCEAVRSALATAAAATTTTTQPPSTVGRRGRPARALLATAAVTTTLLAAWLALRPPAAVLLTVAAPTTVTEGELGTIAWSRQDGTNIAAIVRQVAGPTVRFTERSDADARFVAPLGSATELLRFAIEADGATSRECEIRVQPNPERTAAPSVAEDVFPGGMLGPWRADEANRWQRDESERGVLGNAPLSTTAMRLVAPLGGWTLQGAIEPRHRYVSAAEPKVPIATVALRIELGAVDAVVLRITPSGPEGFTARWVLERRNGEPWQEVRELARRDGAFDAAAPLRFACRWQPAADGGEALVVGWAAADGTIAEAVALARRELPGAGTPGRFELSIDRGVAVFTDWRLRGE
ncbi:MAG: hypothetical protein RL398_510 [Planctomycetota bacterium]